MILGRYRITYANGISQEKNLIEHSDLTDIIYPTLDEIERIEEENTAKVAKKLAAPLKEGLKKQFGEYWFTNKSPLYDAIETGILKLLPQEGGDHQVKMEKLS